MKNQTSLLRWASLCAFVLVVFVSFGHPAGAAAEAKKDKAPGRADVVTIDAMAKDGKLELPPVTFLHDQHTKALAVLQQDCSSCHKPLKDSPDGSYAFTYMGRDDKLKGDAVKALYHENCIKCHTTLAGQGKKTGPLEAECRSCHNPRPAVTDARKDIGFDKILHFKHTASAAIPAQDDPKKNCAACHHVYDAATQKLVWGKDKEDSCRSCHMLPQEKAKILAKNPQAVDANGEIGKRLTLPDAGHQECINCHLAVTAKRQSNEVKSGPADCAGCHGVEAQAARKTEMANVLVATSIPRLERGQPDAVLLLPVAAKPEELKGTMRPVSFNHKLHEAAAMDCRTCHHKKIAACGDCHTLEGKMDGTTAIPPVAVAMHDAQSSRSCVGCHAVETAKPSCAGCHSTMEKGLTKDSCATCHSIPLGATAEQAETGGLIKASKEEKAALAARTVTAREHARVSTFADADIPETVTIGLLSKDYEPSKMPHRKIVKTLLDKQSQNKLAGVFHTEKATLCQGCHHNSPPSKTPPKCVSCHGVELKASPDGRPALKAAYHLQCMTCHAQMQQKPASSECADCHKTSGNQ